ncbi:hypothetical protein R1flu_028705 [Riccia fluitans]|uniref:Uncharacterized protein n=1 Tax=Riccia fluitans TaxID=41844 RepID=A0ABD1XMF8_9MARC
MRSFRSSNTLVYFEFPFILSVGESFIDATNLIASSSFVHHPIRSMDRLITAEVHLRTLLTASIVSLFCLHSKTCPFVAARPARRPPHRSSQPGGRPARTQTGNLRSLLFPCESHMS